MLPSRNQRGFTLIEIVAAFAILALGLGISMEIATGALKQARRGASFTEAALHAKTVLDTAGVGVRLEEGTTEGEFDDGYRWQLEVTPYEPPKAEGAPAAVEPVMEIYQLALTVSWNEGRQERNARFTTLRTLIPAVP